ncbi:peptidase u61 ld-carboxypeptidase a protein [Rutstroemia sp. NJR-2017a WRK4]|nr:peptidase u61 ld-carboxypeptidase a protein [Rutstroemia sp. NJR-2017a WRK4]
MASAVIPKALKPGDTIAFVSPSSRLNELLPTPMLRSAQFFERRGYPVKTIYSPIPTSDSTSIFLQKAQHVANEIHEAFLDPAVTCIITTIGGTEANEILRHIDYEIIRNNPKIFVGYSDITHLLYAFLVKANLRCFYGPCVLTEFAEFPEPDVFTTDHFFQVLQGKGSSGTEGIAGKPLPISTSFTHLDLPFFRALGNGNGKENTQEIRETTPTRPARFLRPGTATGPLLGGCLRKLVSLSGTPFMPPSLHKGAIFFFEVSQGEYSTPMPLARVRSDLVDLINSGLWDDIVGLVVGRTSLYDEKMNRELESMVEELVDGGPDGGYKWPVLFGVDVGHTSPMLTLPFGAVARLDSIKNEFSFLEEGVS